MRDYILNNVVTAYIADGDAVPVRVDIIDHLGQSLLGERPPVPTVIGSIQDRVYTVGSGPYTINLAAKFDGATSFLVVPQPAGVFLQGAVLTLDPAVPLTRTAIAVHGVGIGGTSVPITFYLTVEAVDEVDPPEPGPSTPSERTAPMVQATSYDVGTVATGADGSYIGGPALAIIERRWQWRANVDAAPSDIPDSNGVSLTVTEALAAGQIRFGNLVDNGGAGSVWFWSSWASVSAAVDRGLPAILANGSIQAQPLVGQPVAMIDPEVSGAISVAYQWYRGDPADGGAAISEAATDSYIPVEADYGEVLWRRAIYTNDAGSVVDDISAGRVGATFSEDWSGYQLGDTYPEISADYDRATSARSVSGAVAIIADAAAPAGLAAQMRGTTASAISIFRRDTDAFFGAHGWAKGEDGYYEELFLFRHTDTGQRFFARSKSVEGNLNVPYASAAAGFSIRMDAVYHLMPGDDPTGTAAGGAVATLAADQLYFVRHRIESNISRLKLWKMGEAEPADWMSMRPHTDPLTGRGPGLGARTSSSTGKTWLYWSCAGNAPAPYWPGHEPTVLLSNDAMAYAPPAPATQFTQINDLVAWNFEDI